MLKIKIIIPLFYFLVSGNFIGQNKKIKSLDIENKTLKQINKHNKAIHLMENVWMRDPFIQLNSDGYYYLSCTRRLENLKLEKPKGGIEVFRSKDLVNWESLGLIWTTNESVWGQKMEQRAVSEENKHSVKSVMIWAPEIHFINNKWIVVYTSNQGSANLMISKDNKLQGPFLEPFGTDFGNHHDPTIFMDGDQPWLVDKIAEITPLKKDFTGFDGEPIKIGPSDRKMGHEGAYIIKIKDKYILFGTAWSTDKMRQGTYNLYYAVSDNLAGPYGSRKFAGRFLGHGTPFKDKNGNWWCTAFYNANKSSLTASEIKKMNLSDTAYTINKQGLTIVPIDILYKNNDIEIKILDKDYAVPGLEELQKF
jgi:arylsulfatase